MARSAKALLVLTLAAVATGVQSRNADAQDASALLRASINAPAHLSYAGQVENVRFGNSGSEATIYRIEHRAPDMTRRTYIAPQALYGDWIVTRGAQSYNVDVSHRRVIVATNATVDDQVALNDNFGLLRSNYTALPGTSDVVAGRATTNIALMNKYTGQIIMRVWIDNQTHLALEKESYAPNGSIISHMRFEQIRYTDNFPSAIFDVPHLSGYAIVPGMSHGPTSSNVQASVRAAGFAARGPKYLPLGFVPVTGDVSDVKGIRTLHLLYSDGIRTISLFENNRGAAVDLSRYKVQTTRFEDHEGQYVQDGPTTLLTWAEAGLHFALVGDLSRQELSRIAASVVP